MSEIQKIIDKYLDKGASLLEIEEGVLGYGKLLLYDIPHMRGSILIKEVYVSEWSCTHKIIWYSKIPKKYLKAIDYQ